MMFIVAVTLNDEIESLAERETALIQNNIKWNQK